MRKKYFIIVLIGIYSIFIKVQAQEKKDIFEFYGQTQNNNSTIKNTIIINKTNITDSENNGQIKSNNTNNTNIDIVKNQDNNDEILIDKTQDLPSNVLYKWMFAVQSYPRNYKKIQSMLKNGQNVNAIIFSDGYYGQSTLLHIAAWQDDVRLFQLGIEYGGKISLQTNNGDNVLHFAAKAKNDEIIKLALQKEHNIQVINQKNKEGMTPLMFNAVGGNLNSAVLLIKNRADLNLQDNKGKTALDYAIMAKNWKLAQLYIESGANLNLKDDENNDFNNYLLNYGTMTGFKILKKYANPTVQSIIQQKESQ